MSRWKSWMGVMVGVLVSGCGVPSLYPLYTDKDLVFEPALIGTWDSKEGPVCKFTKGPNKSYELIYTEKKSSAKFEAHLVRLGKDMFLDTFPDVSAIGKNDFYSMHIVPVHIFFKVNLKGDELRFQTLNADWFKEGIKQKKLQVKYEALGHDRFLLTMPTKELQAFVIKHADKAFKSGSDDNILYRKK